MVSGSFRGFGGFRRRTRRASGRGVIAGREAAGSDGDREADGSDVLARLVVGVEALDAVAAVLARAVRG